MPDNQLDDDEPQQQQQAPVEKIYSDFKYEVTEMKRGLEDGDFINKLTMKGNGLLSYISSDPSVATIGADGKVHIVASGTTTITAMVEDNDYYIYNQHTASYTILVVPGCTYVQYNTETQEFETIVLTNMEQYQLFPTPPATGDVTLNESTKPYMVKENVTVNGNLKLEADAKIVLVDGFRLTINGAIQGGTHTLNVYGQTWQNSIGVLNVKATNDDAIYAQKIYLHSTYVLAETTKSDGKGIYDDNDLGIYGSIVEAKGGPGANGYGLHNNSGKMTIVSGLVSGIGGDNSNGPGGTGIAYAGADNFIVEKNSLITAQGGSVSGGLEDQAGDGLKMLNTTANAYLVIDGGMMLLRGGRNTKRSSAYEDEIERYKKDGYGVQLRWREKTSRQWLIYKGGYFLVSYDSPSGEGGYANFTGSIKNESGQTISFYDSEVRITLKNNSTSSQSGRVTILKIPADGW